MARPLQMDIVRRAYQLWELAGRPEGRDQEFYLQAEQELQKAANEWTREGQCTRPRRFTPFVPRTCAPGRGSDRRPPDFLDARAATA